METYIQPAVHAGVGLVLKRGVCTVRDPPQLVLQLSAYTPDLLHTVSQTTQLLLSTRHLRVRVHTHKQRHTHTHTHTQHTAHSTQHTAHSTHTHTLPHTHTHTHTHT